MTPSSVRRAIFALVLASATSVVACDDDKGEADDAADEGDDDGGKKKKTKKKKKKKKKKKDDDQAKEGGKNEDGVHPPPKLGEWPELKVGAWSRYKMSTGHAQWGVLDKRNTEYLIDAHVEGAVDLAVQAWVDVPNFQDARTTEIKTLKYSMNKGPVRDLKGSALSGQAKLYEQLVKGFMPPKVEGLPQEDVTVPAGTFKGCYVWTSKMEFMGKKSETKIWTHPAVPPPAMVKSEPKDGAGGYQLIDYGFTGAKKSL